MPEAYTSRAEMEDEAAVLAEIHALRERCKTDLSFLGCHVLGYDFFEDLAPFHLAAAQALQDQCDVLFLAPRNHIKTTLMDVVGTIQHLLRYPDDRVLIAAATWSNAKSVLSVILGHFREGGKNGLLHKLFPEFKPQSQLEEGNTEAFTVPCRSRPRVEPSIDTTGQDRSITGRHYDVIRCTDLVVRENVPPTSSAEQMKRTIEWFRTTSSLLDTTNPRAHRSVDGCLVAGTRVLLADGSWLPIEDVQVGATVRCWDGAKGWTTGNVSWSGCVKSAPVYRVALASRTIGASAEHPFLVLPAKRAEYDKHGHAPIWKRAEELRPGDRLVLSQVVDSGEACDPEWAWFLGFLFGDGCLIRQKVRNGKFIGGVEARGVIFSKKVRDHVNARSVAACERFLGKTPADMKRERYYRLDSTPAARKLLAAGFFGGAKTKRVPAWIYRANLAARTAFLRGFMAADGYTHVLWKNGASRVEISNPKLLSDLRELGLTSGAAVGRIHTRVRTIQPPNSPLPVVSQSWTCFFRFGPQSAWGEGFVWERVKSVTVDAPEPVYDVTVDEHHNFVADGIVVHNTRWNLNDLYGEILKNPAYRRFRKIVIGIQSDENGHPIPVWSRMNKDTLLQIKEEVGSYLWASNYLNMPSPLGDVGFRRDWFKPYADIPGVIEVAITIDLAISDKETACDTAIVVTGVDEHRRLYVLCEQHGRFTPHETVERLYALDDVWKPSWIGVETVAYQKAFVYILWDETQRGRRMLPIRTLKSDARKSRRLYVLMNIAQAYGIYVRPEHGDLIEQCCNFQMEGEQTEKVDIADALAYRAQEMYAPLIEASFTRAEKSRVIATPPLTGEALLRLCDNAAKDEESVLPWENIGGAA